MEGGALAESIEGYKEAFSCMDKPFGMLINNKSISIKKILR
jgi:hypothetical protein